MLRRLARVIPRGPGVVVANDWIELALTSIYDSGRAVVAINHGDFDFYYDLAVRHRDTIDAFVTYTERMCLACGSCFRIATIRSFCCRTASIFQAPVRQPAPGRLRLLYVGRLLGGQRRSSICPLIDRRLRELGVDPSWTVQGARAR